MVGTTGAGFTPTAVKGILLRPANAGISTHKGDVVGKGEWPAIIDPDTYATVKTLLTDPARRTTRGRPAVSLLTGIVVCGACGGKMRAGKHSAERRPTDARPAGSKPTGRRPACTPIDGSPCSTRRSPS